MNLRVAICPHSMDMGGSQLNAIDLADGLARRGHASMIVGPPGALEKRCADLGLGFIPLPPNTIRPSPRQIRFVRELVRSHDLDVVHGFEWPPCITALAAARGTSAVAVGTIMSMSVAPFLPVSLPLTVGTEQIAAAERLRGRDPVVLVPPVDLATHEPVELASSGADFRTRHGIGPDELLVVSVSRLARALKSEGLRSAITTLPRLEPTLRLVLVGDGPARDELQNLADETNARLGRAAVLLVGAMEDPRPAYAAADVVIGLGGSVLRAMALAKPVVVQGENGFWSALNAATLPDFLWTGWYGTGKSVAEGPERLAEAIRPLLADRHTRDTAGAYARAVVEERFSMDVAVDTLLGLYRAAISHGGAYPARDMLRSAGRYVDHALRRKVIRRLTGSLEDFNSASTMSRRTAGVTTRSEDRHV